MSQLRRALRPFARTPLVSRVRLVVAKARLVTRPIRFAAYEMAGRARVANHVCREPHFVVSLRHGTRDTDVLLEIRHAYQPPAGLHLPGSGLVLDVGGNIGLFALLALSTLPECRVISYEPDPANLPALRRNAALNAFSDRWELRPVAVGNSNGEAAFDSGLFADSRVSNSGEVVVPVVDLFEQPAAALMKIDIEGSEWSILRDPRLSGLRAGILVMEWHTHATDGTTGGEPEAKALLARAGFHIASSYHMPGRDHGTIWAIRG
jgi:FkbM family methyltransferase